MRYKEKEITWDIFWITITNNAYLHAMLEMEKTACKFVHTLELCHCTLHSISLI